MISFSDALRFRIDWGRVAVDRGGTRKKGSGRNRLLVVRTRQQERHGLHLLYIEREGRGGPGSTAEAPLAARSTSILLD